MPVAENKTISPTQFLIYFGLLLNFKNQVLAIPIEKRDKCTKLIDENVQGLPEMADRPGTITTEVGRTSKLHMSSNSSRTDFSWKSVCTSGANPWQKSVARSPQMT